MTKYKRPREECDVLAQSGVIDPKRHGLIEGEPIYKVPKNHPYMSAVMLVCEWLRLIFVGVCVPRKPSIHLAPITSRAKGVMSSRKFVL